MQSSLARKKKKSNNWIKAKKKLAHAYKKTAYVRNAFLHKDSNEICKNHAVIVMEDLDVMNMSKSTRGTQENPGYNVKVKSILNKKIFDRGVSSTVKQELSVVCPLRINHGNLLALVGGGCHAKILQVY